MHERNLTRASSDVEFRRVAAINPNSLNPDGSLRSLLEQYAEVQMRRVADENYRAPGPYVLAFDGGFTGIPQMTGKPIVFSGRSLKHVLQKHGADINALANLIGEIRDNVLAYENPENPDKITFVLNAKSEGGHDMITVLRADLNMNQIDVSSVRSVHGRARELLMKSMAESLDLNRNFYLNEKSGAWLEIQKHIPDDSGVAKEVLKRLTHLNSSRKSLGAPSRIAPGPDRSQSAATPAKTNEAMAASARAQAQPQVPAANVPKAVL